MKVGSCSYWELHRFLLLNRCEKEVLPIFIPQLVLFWLFLSSKTAEAKQQQRSDFCVAVSTDAFQSTAAAMPELGAGKVRGQGANTFSHAPSNVISQKCPMWLRRKALITPLNGAAASVGEWRLADVNLLQDFQRLHHYYGQEVKKAREEWLKGQGKEEQRGEGDLLDLG